MKKNGKELKVTKAGVYAAMMSLVLILGISACGPKAEEGNGMSSAQTPSTGDETPTSESAETVEPSASEGMESDADVASDGVVESGVAMEESMEPVVEEVCFEADIFMSLIDDLTAKYSNMETKQLQAAILVANYDHITKEDWDMLLDTYSFSEEELNNQFNAFVESYQAGIWATASYYMAVIEPKKDKEAYEKLIKFEEFALTDKDREIAKTYDNVFSKNASAAYGQDKVGSILNAKNFYNLAVFEIACKRLQHFILYSEHPQEFNDVSNVFTK